MVIVKDESNIVLLKMKILVFVSHVTRVFLLKLVCVALEIKDLEMVNVVPSICPHQELNYLKDHQVEFKDLSKTKEVLIAK